MENLDEALLKLQNLIPGSQVTAEYDDKYCALVVRVISDLFKNWDMLDRFAKLTDLVADNIPSLQEDEIVFEAYVDKEEQDLYTKRARRK